MYTPHPNFYGTDQFSYTIHDGRMTNERQHAEDDCDDGGDQCSAAIVVTLEVIPNTAPVAHDDIFVVRWDKTIEIENANVLANDVDPEESSLKVAIPFSSIDLGHGVMSLSEAGGFSFEPNDVAATFTFTYQATDDALRSNHATVTVHVVPPTSTVEPVVARKDYFTTGREITLQGNLLTHVDNLEYYKEDSDDEFTETTTVTLIDPDTGDPLTATSTGVNPLVYELEHGVLTLYTQTVLGDAEDDSDDIPVGAFTFVPAVGVPDGTIEELVT